MINGMHLTAIGGCNVLLEPGVGLDPADPEAYVEPLLVYLRSAAAERLLYDMGNVYVIDQVYYDWLLRLHRVCRISGIELITVNMRPPAAYALSLMLNETPPFACALNVNEAR